ncbi:hypothetical protein C0992_003271, partial [Termitomyces sp. T32_za158]
MVSPPQLPAASGSAYRPAFASNSMSSAASPNITPSTGAISTSETASSRSSGAGPGANAGTQ